MRHSPRVAIWGATHSSTARLPGSTASLDLLDGSAGEDNRDLSAPLLRPGLAGPHFCLGAHSARIEIHALLRELLTRLVDLRPTGPTKHLPITYRPV